MSKILFFSQPTMGHTNAMLTISVKLKDLGHDVSFGVPTIETESPIDIGKMPNIIKTSLSIPEKIKANGINFVSVKIPKKIAFKAMLLPLTKGFIETEFAKDIFSDCMLEYAKTIERIVLAFNPNVLVNDFSFIAPFVVAQKHNIPCVPVYHSGLPFDGDGIPPFGSGLDING